MMTMRITPPWLGNVHWLVLTAIAWTLVYLCMRLYKRTGDVLPLSLGMTSIFGALIVTCFWLVHIDIPLPSSYFFLVERIAWYPLWVSVFISFDIVAASLNRHLSLIHRLDLFLHRRDAPYVHNYE